MYFYRAMKNLILLLVLACSFALPQGKYRSGSDVTDDGLASQIQKEQKEEDEKKRQELFRERDRILKETREAEEERRQKISDEPRVQDGALTISQDISAPERSAVPIREVLNKQIDRFISRLKVDLEKTSRLDVFNIDASESLGAGEESISLVNPKPLKGQSDEDFKRELLKLKDKARSHTVRAMLLDVTYGSGFEKNFGAYIYEKISSEKFYTKFPQEIDFVDCYRCIYSGEISVVQKDGAIRLEKNKQDVARAKQLQKKYKLDVYGKVFVSYENRLLRFQTLFFDAKTNQLLWSRSYIYSVNSLTGRSFTMDLGVNFMVSPNENVNQNPIGGDLRLGSRFLGVGSAGFRFYIGSGFKDKFASPQLILLNGFFDFFITDLIPNYDNRVAAAIGIDTGIALQRFLEAPAVFYNLGFSFRLNFLNSAYIFAGVIFDVGQQNAKTKFNAVIGPSFNFGVGMIIL